MHGPKSCRKSIPVMFMGPSDSMANGVKSCVTGRFAYFARLRSAACSASPSVVEAVRCARMNSCCVPCNISPSRPRDQCGSVRSFTIGADKTRWFLGARDAGFRESSPNDVVDGGMSSRSFHRPSACQGMMSTLVGDLSTFIGIDSVHRELVRGVIQQQL